MPFVRAFKHEPILNFHQSELEIEVEEPPEIKTSGSVVTELYSDMDDVIEESPSV